MAKNILEIDKLNLDREVAEHSLLIQQYMTELADARYKVDRAKADLELTEAEIDSAIRHKPEDYGLAKVSNDAIRAIIVQQKEYQTNLKVYHRAIQLLGVAQAVVSALDNRKYALKSMVDLWLAEYYSTPKVGAEANEALEERSKREVRAKGRERLRSKFREEEEE